MFSIQSLLMVYICARNSLVFNQSEHIGNILNMCIHKVSSGFLACISLICHFPLAVSLLVLIFAIVCVEVPFRETHIPRFACQ
ncbi:hypothetical protein FKM82_014216 [Ascaphus truei]